MSKSISKRSAPNAGDPRRGKPPLKEPAPSVAEADAIQKAGKRLYSRRTRLEVSAKGNEGCLHIGAPHADEGGFAVRMRDCFGTTSKGFQDQAVGRLGAIMRRKGADLPTEIELNAGLAAVDGMQPRDEVEAMLAMQMVATHEMGMEMLTRAKQAEYMPALQECGSLAVRLFRAYAAQVEALARLRRGGEQRVIVQHVTVNEGGQAIVGSVEGGGKKKMKENPMQWLVHADSQTGDRSGIFSVAGKRCCRMHRRAVLSGTR